MAELDVIEELKPNNEILKIISKSKLTCLKITNGKINHIKQTNIKSVEQIIYELILKEKLIIIWQYLLKK